MNWLGVTVVLLLAPGLLLLTAVVAYLGFGRRKSDEDRP